MNDLARLDARSFHSHLAGLLRAEFVAQGAFLAALAEFDRRRSFRDLGFASLFEYLHRGLRLSRGAAHHRRAAAWLVARFPEVLGPIQDGRLCFTTASILATVLTEENRTEVLPRFFGLSKLEALEVAAELKPAEGGAGTDGGDAGGPGRSGRAGRGGPADRDGRAGGSGRAGRAARILDRRSPESSPG